MLRSMTGYSTSCFSDGKFTLSIVLKSTNHRFLDLQMRLPPPLEFLEPRIRQLLKERALRGHLEITVSLEEHDGARLKLDRNLLEAYFHTCKSLREEFGLVSEPDLVALLRIPGMVAGASPISEGEQESLGAAAGRAIVEAIDRLNQMREREGDALARDSVLRLRKLEKLGASVKELSTQIAPAFRERLEKRIRDLTRSEAIDPSRVAQEVTLLCLRTDITEEVTRFESHVAQAQRVLEEGPEAGKKLDFLLQEMNREANTMLAKTTDVPGPGAEIAASAIEMKLEIEKLREQAQNME